MRRDSARLQDILDCADRLASYVAGVHRTDFVDDNKTRAAAEREIMIIGEAAHCVSEAYKAAHPEVPWQRLNQLRNFYIHGYERLDPTQVWATATRFIPKVRRIVAPLIAGADDAELRGEAG